MERARELTIYDIAREAGVSISTVSRVLNGNKNVTPETRKRIEEVIEKNDYSPSSIARGMSKKSMKTIGVVALRFTEIHHMVIAQFIADYFSDKDYSIVMFSTGDRSVASLDSFFKRVRESKLDGLIFIGSTFSVLTEHRKQINSILSDIPVVIVNGWLDGTYGILVDEGAGMAQVVNAIKARSRKRILYLKGAETDSAKRKELGFIAAANSANFDALTIRYTGHITSEIKKALFEMSDADAVVCDEDYLASFSIKYLQERGVRIPEDVIVTGYNNSEYSAMSYPEIASVDNLPKEQGRVAASLLDNLLKGNVDKLEKSVIAEVRPVFIEKGSIG